MLVQQHMVWKKDGAKKKTFRSHWYSAVGDCHPEIVELSFSQNEHNIQINLNHRSHKNFLKAPAIFKEIAYLKLIF